MSLAYDENGRPFIILREQEMKKRVKGLDAHKVSFSSDIKDKDELLTQNILEYVMECPLICALILILFSL
jgi:hypothetical protein